MRVWLCALLLCGCWDWDQFRGADASEGVCPCFAGDGAYCGARALAGAEAAGCELPLGGVTESTLLSCGDGVWTVRDDCADECTFNPGGPLDDACLLLDCDCFVLEAFCGAGAQRIADERRCQVPLLPEHDGDILHCPGGVWTVRDDCRHGCRQAPAGTPDDCRAQSVYRLPFACDREAVVSNATHTGRDRFAVDFDVPPGTDVRAMREGTVLRVRNVSPPGSPCFEGGGAACVDLANTVEVRHDDGTVALYMHLQQILATVGQAIPRGGMLGLSGSSGTDTPQLHVQVQRDCGIWRCQSLPIAFEEAELVTGATATSMNCE